ncbi:hypothetical protein KIH39_25940 [Telmatocola sphagniphila]|uniref:Uncharacterized protein n=1 Tax=Telmatocola sphagniphila TaxID=1123043 RepID=A0A8E6B687_9BACT|nr:hypothetical protein [Telmatocola sphagniphila]QVL32234.1 hypothetical protein KIH39_25940 [Telmatocola sphagniphila]
MPIRFACPSCLATLQIATKKAETIVKCPKCSSKIKVPKTLLKTEVKNNDKIVIPNEDIREGFLIDPPIQQESSSQRNLDYGFEDIKENFGKFCTDCGAKIRTTPCHLDKFVPVTIKLSSISALSELFTTNFAI